MSFKKLIEPLKDALKVQGFEAPLPFQKKSLSKIKGGANVFGIAPKGSGKTTAMVLGVVQKLEGKAVDEAPRAIIFAKDKEAVLELYREFRKFTSRTDLRVYCVYEEHNIDAQRDDIYDGIDILITTPKRFNKLFFMNNVNVRMLQMFVVDDAEFLFRGSHLSDVSRLPESLERCQYLVFSTKYDERFDRWQEKFMFHPQMVMVK
ncbi:DEAD/DEAH box helicase [Xanthomarina spongicola]|jgi:superfamily II DNA/RNA helicase|uniref:RAD3-like DEAD/DEAH box helicase n=1 Tax=Xanthomarina spongicola TaxID=570520 RepID=A0A316DIV7_9FLAO|nr:DEAD/DEAH box helicase [Xanthomarina spongicola]PWK17432.1 RAD3-like DEAD/DEAH box helicase [Xanthomarina spongicola]